MMKRKNNKKIVIAGIVIGIVFALFVGCGIYVSDFYAAAELTTLSLDTDEKVIYTELEDGSYILEPTESYSLNKGFIFYPGGKVENTAYAPLVRNLAENGISCIVAKMPFNLAVFDMKAADRLKVLCPDINEWYIGGHSLGGSMAASYVSDHAGEYEGVVLLGSYSTADLSDTDLEVLSVYGSNDEVLNIDKYKQYYSNLPQTVIEKVIEGGCHSYFGEYGEQQGDGTATITSQAQQELTSQLILDLILN